MTWVFAVLVVLVMGGIAAVAVGRGAPMAEEHVDRPDTLVPAAGLLSAADLRAVRFPLVVRGYRMADVDALLDRLAEQLEQERTGEAAFAPGEAEPAAEPDPEPDPGSDPEFDPGSDRESTDPSTDLFRP